MVKVLFQLTGRCVNNLLRVVVIVYKQIVDNKISSWEMLGSQYFEKSIELQEFILLVERLFIVCYSNEFVGFGQ